MVEMWGQMRLLGSLQTSGYRFKGVKSCRKNQAPTLGIIVKIVMLRMRKMILATDLLSHAQSFTCLITFNPGTGHFCLLMEEKARAQRGQVTCPRSHSLSGRGALDPGLGC